MGTIYKRGDTYWIQYFHKGKRIRESTGSDRLKKAQQLLQIREGDIAAGKPPRVNFEKVTFDELSKELLADYRLNKRKATNRAELSISHLEPFFGGNAMPSITTTRITKYIEKRLEEKAANATINRELSALKRMFNLGAEQTPPKIDRVPYIPMLKEQNTRKGFFEHDAFLRLRDALPEHLRGLATFGYKLGWRLGELRKLTWSRVDLKRGIVRLEAGESKNDEPRTVFLDEELKAILQARHDARTEQEKILPYIFLNINSDTQLQGFRKSWLTACKNAKVGERLFHDFRRTAIRNMVRAGVPERVAMQISGHKTRSVFDRYNIVNEDDLKQAAQRQAHYLQTLHTGEQTAQVIELKEGKK